MIKFNQLERNEEQSAMDYLEVFIDTYEIIDLTWVQYHGVCDYFYGFSTKLSVTRLKSAEGRLMEM
jgi:hypothetical protein